MSPSAQCSSCGGPRNHWLDGVLLAKCTGCNDLKVRVLTPNRAVPKPLSTDARQLIKQINDMLMDGYSWAADTLSGIRETVLKTGHASDRQWTAVQNIEEAKRERD